MAKFKLKDPSTNSLAWLALLVAAVALVMATLVYSQSRGGLLPGIKSDAQMGLKTVEQQAAVMRAMQSLEDLRSGVASGVIPASEVQSRLSQIRSDLARAYQNASVEAKKTWLVVDNVLAQIGQDLKVGTLTILDALDKGIRNLKKFIR